MDSTLKRFISFIPVLILCFSLSLTAEAAGTGTAENNTQKTAKKASAEKKQVTAKQVSQADNTKVKKAPEQAEAALPDNSYLKDRELLDMGLDFGMKVDSFDKKYQEWKRKQHHEA